MHLDIAKGHCPDRHSVGRRDWRINTELSHYLKPDFREVDEYFERARDSKNPEWIQLRHLIAVILWRERGFKRSSASAS